MFVHWRNHDQSKQQKKPIINKNAFNQHNISAIERHGIDPLPEFSVDMLQHLFRSQNTISHSVKKRLFSKTHSLPLFTSTPSTESLTISKNDIDDYINKCLIDAIENGTEVIDLSCLALREIPSSLTDLNGMICTKKSGSLSSIVTQPSIQLFLQGNLIQEISYLFTIQNLTVLSLRNNQLDYIPPSISQLTRLVELNIGGNQIRFLPKEITKLESLQVFNPYPNPFITLDQLVKYNSSSFSYSLQELCFRMLKHNSKITRFPKHLIERIKYAQEIGTNCMNCHCLHHVPTIRVIEFSIFCTKTDLPMISFYCSQKCANTNQ